MVANLFEKGADVDARDKVRIDMFVGPMYRLGLLYVIPLNFTRHNVNRTIGWIYVCLCRYSLSLRLCHLLSSNMTDVCT
jgi:hypothetical protein